MYNKRIGFIIPSSYMKNTGGVGQFCKSFVELMDKNSIKVDIICDQKPFNKIYAENLNTNVVYPDDPYSYGTHRNIFMYGDSFCFERQANFRNAILKALSQNMYDALICNCYESLHVAIGMGLQDSIQIIGYTHLHSQIFSQTQNPFLDNVNFMMRKDLLTPGLFVATQSKYNETTLTQSGVNAYTCPIPLPEQSLLREYHNDREGVLFIGRWEEGKNPELFLELIEKTKFPAKVITSETGAKKFAQRLKEIGVPYDVRADVVGKEKVDFITSARVAFNPSNIESYGLAFQEQQIQLPTVVLKHVNWINNFNKNYYFTCNKKDMDVVIYNLYNNYPTAESWYNKGVLKHWQIEESNIFHKWNTLFSSFVPKRSTSTKAQILQHNTIKYSDYVNGLNRSVLCIDDIVSVYNNKHRYNIIYNAKDTWLTQNPTFAPPITQEEELFEFS